MPSFSETMDSAVLSGTTLTVNVSEEWLQGRTIYGGMQAAIVVKAMRQMVDPAVPLRSLQVTFIGPVAAGKIEAQAVLLRQGRSAAHVEARIVEEGRSRVFALGIFGANRQSEAFHEPAMPPAPVSIEDAMELPDMENRPAFFHQFESRLAEGAPLFSGTRDARSKIYTRLRDSAPCSDESLTALADLAPPVASMQLTRPAPNSSMNWQLDFVRTPQQVQGTAWFRVDADVAACGNGYGWQNSEIWTESGELVMLSRQCTAVFG